jgi:hypothetical protein
MVLSATVEAMEAMVAERGTKVTEWNDGRLDDLSKRMDEGFIQVREEFGRVHARIDRVDDSLRHLGTRFDALQRTLVHMTMVMLAALIGLIATQI